MCGSTGMYVLAGTLGFIVGAVMTAIVSKWLMKWRDTLGF